MVERAPHLADEYTQRKFTPDSKPLQVSSNSEQSDSELQHWYTLEILNHGQGLLPVPLELTLNDGRHIRLQVPAQAWMRAERGKLSLQLPVAEPLSHLCIDPLWLTPDTERNNNCVDVREP